jgi:hypothetical protein
MGRGRKRASGGDAGEESIDAQLDALYAELPKLDCKGKCWHSCGPVLMAPGERARILREGGVKIPTYPPERHGQLMTCPAVKSHRCTVHTVRPLMCRLWGIADWMRCPDGCKPEGGWMSREEATRFFLRAYLIAGWPVEQPEDRMTPKQITDQLRRLEAKFKIKPPERIDPGPANADGERVSVLRRWKRAK